MFRRERKKKKKLDAVIINLVLVIQDVINPGIEHAQSEDPYLAQAVSLSLKVRSSLCYAGFEGRMVTIYINIAIVEVS